MKTVTQINTWTVINDIHATKSLALITNESTTQYTIN